MDSPLFVVHLLCFKEHEGQTNGEYGSLIKNN